MFHSIQEPSRSRSWTIKVVPGFFLSGCSRASPLSLPSDFYLGSEQVSPGSAPSNCSHTVHRHSSALPGYSTTWRCSQELQQRWELLLLFIFLGFPLLDVDSHSFCSGLRVRMVVNHPLNHQLCFPLIVSVPSVWLLPLFSGFLGLGVNKRDNIPASFCLLTQKPEKVKVDVCFML